MTGRARTIAVRAALLAVVVAAAAPAGAMEEPPRWIANAYWSRDFGSRIGPVVLADLNGDGWSEIGVHEEGVAWHWLDSAGGTLWRRQSTVADGLKVRVVEPREGAPGLLLLAAPAGGRATLLYALGVGGEELWWRRLDFRLETMEAWRDSGASIRILLGAEGHGTTMELDGDGAVRWRQVLGNGPVDRFVPFPAHGDGRPGDAVLAALGSGRGAGAPPRVVLLGEDGRIRWLRDLPVDSDQEIDLEVRVAELDGDGTTDVLVLAKSFGREGSDLCRLGAEGRVVWCRSLEDWNHRLLEPGPVPLGGGDRPVLVQGYDRVALRARDGEPLPEAPLLPRDVPTPSLALGRLEARGDLDGDGREEGIFVSGRVLSLVALAQEGPLPHRRSHLWRSDPMPGSAPRHHHVERHFLLSVSHTPQTSIEGTARSYVRNLMTAGPVRWQTILEEPVRSSWLHDGGSAGAYVLTGAPRHVGDSPSPVEGWPGGRLMHLRGMDGAVTWHRPIEERVTVLAGTGAPNDPAARLAVGTTRGLEEPAAIFLFDTQGTPVARVPTPGPVAEIVATGGRLYATGLARNENAWLLAFEPDGRVRWQRPLGWLYPRLAAGTGLAGQVRILAGRSLFDDTGRPWSHLDVAASIRFVRVGHLDDDGVPEAVLVSLDEERGQAQYHVLDDDGSIVEARPLPYLPTAFAVGHGRQGPLLLAGVPRRPGYRVDALSPRGEVLYSFPVDEEVVALSPAGDSDGFLYATGSGGAAEVGSAYRPPPLAAAPRLDVATDEYRLRVFPTGVPVSVRLQVRRGATRRWDDLGELRTGAEEPEELRWPVQPFGLPDVGRPAVFRVVYEEWGTGAAWEGATAPLTAARELPLRWRFVQRTALAVLLFVALAAALGGGYLYRRLRQRRFEYRDLLVRWEAVGGLPRAVEIAGDGVPPRCRLVPPAELDRLLEEAVALDQTSEGGARVLEHRLRTVQERMLHLVAGEDLRQVLYGGRHPVRLRLDLSAAGPAIQELPWELLLLSPGANRESRPEQLLQAGLSLLRFLPSGEPLRLPVVPGPLVVLAVHPDLPEDAGVDEEKELEELEAATRSLRGARRLELRTLIGEEATLEGLAKRLEEPVDVLHVLGHGDVDQPALRLNDGWGDPHPVELARLRELLQNRRGGSRSPFLLFLNVCSSATAIRELADGLVRPGYLAALVAAGAAIEGRAAALFAERFYRALVESGQLDHAAERGRQGIMQILPDQAQLLSRDWAVPRIFTRAVERRLFQRT